MARPLELSFDSRGRIAVSTAGAVLVILLLSLTGSYGWPAVAAVVALLWAGFLVTVWLRSRAFLMVDEVQAHRPALPWAAHRGRLPGAASD